MAAPEPGISLEDFLRKKRIAPDAFRAALPEEWAEYERLFQEMGPVSFDYQKKFFFNGLRRAFPLPPEPALPAEAPAAPERKKLILKRPASTAPEAEAAEAPQPEAPAAPERKKLVLRPAAPPAETAGPPARALKKPLPLRTVIKKPEPPQASGEESSPNHAEDPL